MYLSKPFVNAKGYFKNMTIGYFWDNLMWMVHNNIIIKIDRSNHFSFLRTHIMRNIEAKWCYICWKKITFFDKDILEMNSWWSIMINCSHHSYRFINSSYLFFFRCVDLKTIFQIHVALKRTYLSVWQNTNLGRFN